MSRCDQKGIYMMSTIVRSFRWMLALGCFTLYIFPPDAYAEISPTQAIKKTTDAIFAILEDPNLAPPEKTAERRAHMRDIVAARFDYGTMARRTLAAHWKERSVEERREFTALLSRLLVNSYITIIESRTDEQVSYLSEEIKKDFAQVKTEIVAKSGTIPVDYRMRKKAGKWQTYDVIIEGVSLVNNFRRQFDRIIRLESYTILTDRLKKKTAISPSP